MYGLVIDRIIHALFERDTNCIYRSDGKARGLYGIVLAVSGSALYTFEDGTKRLLCKGDLALFSDAAVYTVVNAEDVPFEHYSINFTLAHGCGGFPEAIFLTPMDLASYTERCGAVLDCIGRGDGMRAMSFLYAILADIAEDPSREVYFGEILRGVRPAIDYIESEYAARITVDALASLCMMSNTNFRRVFKRECGVSPIEYLLRVRVDGARRLLLHSPLSVADVARYCGFKDVEYFCRVFKRRQGVSAEEYRALAAE